MPSFDIFQEVQNVDPVRVSISTICNQLEEEDGGSIGDLEAVVTNINVVEEIHDKACDDVIIQQMFDDNHNGDKHEDLKIAMKKYIAVHRLKQRFMSAKLIFIPVICDSHYYCVVVNFNLKKIQILDNRKYGAEDELKFTVCAPILVEIIDSIFKEYKCAVTTGSTYDIEIIPFHWKTPTRNTRNVDSSLFLMLHMFFFKGENFQSDFNEYLRRRLYKVAIGAAIILHPLNTCRSNILQKVEEFNPEKNKRLNDEDKTTQIRVYKKKK